MRPTSSAGRRSRGTAVSEKPRHHSGYSAEDTELVRAACLTMAVTLGSYLDDLVIVGGLVPSLLIDARLEAADLESDRHVGTMDLDIGLKLALLDSGRYAEIQRAVASRRLPL